MPDDENGTTWAGAPGTETAPDQQNQPLSGKPQAKPGFLGKLSNSQFGKNHPGIGHAMESASKANFFRHAGMGHALRYTLNLHGEAPKYDALIKQRMDPLNGVQPGLNPTPFHSPETF